jgi:hypothetical protein
VKDYLQCFQSDTAKASVIDELDALYGELEKPGERLETMSVIGDPNTYIDSPASDDDDEELL